MNLVSLACILALIRSVMNIMVRYSGYRVRFRLGLTKLALR